MNESAFALTHNVPEYTVRDLALGIKRVVEDGFSHVRVRGEISGCKVHTSGHVYLALKDEEALINAICWKGVYRTLGMALEDGMDVIATGRVTTYPGRSQYQLVIERVELAGRGALLKLLEERKEKLRAEGLFDAAHKKPLPLLPQTIGVITSPTGAVIRDILHRLQERFPVHVYVWPVLVQGDAAPAQMIEALRGFEHPTLRPDLLIIARGGGSFEDLLPFYDESLVRAVHACPIPVISAIGHETDTTLLDFVADKRAPTPTAAAEMAVPVRTDLLARTSVLQGRLQSFMTREITSTRQRVQLLAQRLDALKRMLDGPTQRLDDLTERLPRALEKQVVQRQMRLLSVLGRLSPPLGLIQQDTHALERISHRLISAMYLYLERRQTRLDPLLARLHASSYEHTLARGFALVRDATTNRMITQGATLSSGQDITLQFHDSEIAATVKN